MKDFVKELIGRLEKLKIGVMLNNKCCKHIIDKIIAIVNQLAEEYNQDLTKVSQGWIPVSERLPEEATTYQVTEEVVINSRKQYVVDIRLFGTEGEWLCPSNRKIIAWQPLPAPYQPKGE